jgi:predicted benzoate:H+ symporter BenE
MEVHAVKIHILLRYILVVVYLLLLAHHVVYLVIDVLLAGSEAVLIAGQVDGIR